MDSDSAKCHPEGRLLYWGLERERGEALEAPRGQFLNASVWLLKGWKHPWVPGAELSDACSREHRKCYESSLASACVRWSCADPDPRWDPLARGSEEGYSEVTRTVIESLPCGYITFFLKF